MAEISFIPHHSNSLKSANSDEISKKSGEMVPGNFLGIDYGKMKIGLAIADGETKIAFAFDTLKNDNQFLPKLRELIRKEEIKNIIIGITSHGFDKSGVDDKKKFAEKIEKETGVKVDFQEEMFTSKMAQDNISNSGKGKLKEDDSEAARIILQDWLDRNKNFQFLQ